MVPDQPRRSTGRGPATANDPARRRLLAGMLGAYVASLIPRAWAQPAPTAAQGNFVALSALLVGRPTLDAVLAGRLHDALAASRPQWDVDMQTLLALIEKRRIAPAQLQQALDQDHSALAPLPRQILRAWTLGVVGEKEGSRCLAYEDALNAVIVADVLKPPTYAYGAYGSWASKPA